VKRNRCRTALAQAMALGLPEQEIRAMAKKTEWQLQQPATDAQPASSTAPRKRGR
jgi:adenylosuccinate lyase